MYKRQPLERRKKFLEIINKYGVPAIEDNPYGELRFKGEYQPALKSMDTEGLVIYMGTFSKIMAPGYRIGWTCANDEVIEKLNLIAQAAALQTSTIAPMIISKYMDMFDLDAHVDKIRETYKHRCQLMINTMKAVSYTHLDVYKRQGAGGADIAQLLFRRLSPELLAGEAEELFEKQRRRTVARGQGAVVDFLGPDEELFRPPGGAEEAALFIGKVLQKRAGQGLGGGDMPGLEVRTVPVSYTHLDVYKRQPKDCQAAMLFGGKSNKTCTFACIGLGNCVKACPFGAMEIADGIAKVNRAKCCLLYTSRCV